MGWWFGRKSAPADARPFVPAWLCSDMAEEGFARSFDGLSVYVRSEGVPALFRGGTWEIGSLRGARLVIEGQQVVGGRFGSISNPAGGGNVDIEARNAILEILAALRGHGLIET